MRRWLLFLVVVLTALGCAHWAARRVDDPPDPAANGRQIVILGRHLDIGTPVVLWNDPGGYNAYLGGAAGQKVHAPRDDAAGPVTDLSSLRQVVDQFVIHYDGCATSRTCFRVLRERGLSVHFLLDVDGTIYQTLDLSERAWHATIANNRSIGVEIAHPGAFPEAAPAELDRWYRREPAGGVRLVLPPHFGNGGIRTPGFIAHPARPDLIAGTIQGQRLVQYDFTPQQYQALAKLAAGLCRAFPRLHPGYPQDATGRLVPQKLSDASLASWRGLLGHYHIQTNKIDPGPAFQWDALLAGLRAELAR